MHLDEEHVRLLIHGELEPARMAAATDHVAGCAACRTLLDHARQDEAELLAMLRLLDHAPPAVAAEELMLRARPGGRSWMRRAAVIVFALAAAGTAWAAPGSPVRSWIGRMLRTHDDAPAPAPGLAVPQPELLPSDSLGLAVPAGTALTLVMPDPPRAGFAIISLVEGSEVAAHTAGQASFTAEEGRMRIETTADSLDLVIGIPREAPRVEVVIGGRRLFLKDGARIETVAQPDPPNRWRLPFRSR